MNTNPNPTVRAMLQVSTCADGAQAADSPALPVLDFTASNGALDRYHEIIDPAGWRLESYRRNPVFQNAHNYG
ncbi:MAG TPA: hypothetical protein VN673_11145, partial [Clostridia bacterium]|nr:hypothetical protein [Clostridia bacterium]